MKWGQDSKTLAYILTSCCLAIPACLVGPQHASNLARGEDGDGNVSPAQHGMAWHGIMDGLLMCTALHRQLSRTFPRPSSCCKVVQELACVLARSLKQSHLRHNQPTSFLVLVPARLRSGVVAWENASIFAPLRFARSIKCLSKLPLLPVMCACPKLLPRIVTESDEKHGGQSRESLRRLWDYPLPPVSETATFTRSTPPTWILLFWVCCLPS